MASAFDCATNTSLVLATSSSPCVAAATSEPQEQQQPLATAAAAAAESETEDEEVKMNCVGGVRGMEESDVNTTDHSCDEGEEDDDDDDEEKSNIGEEEEGVVSFVTGHLRGALPLVRPKATTPPHQQRPTLSPHMEGEMETSGNSSSDSDEEDGNVNDDDEASTAESDQSSVGARGVALSLGTPSGISDADGSSSENEDEEDSDVEDLESGNKSSLVVEPAAALKTTRLGDQDMEEIKQELHQELLSMNEVLGQSFLSQDLDESESALDHLLGVAQDRDDFINLPKTKRVLSFNTLTSLNAETGRSADSPKRLKASSCSMLSTSFIPDFCLGAPAVEHEQIKMNFRVEARRESPIISSSDEEDLDGQLRDELDPHADEEKSICRDNSPVPLLTPPGSPLTIEIDGGGTTTVCEWPSNLAVDNAMRAAADQEVPEVARSMSPDVSLPEEDSDYTLSGSSSSSQAVFDTSTLTPLLQGISMGNHR